MRWNDVFESDNERKQLIKKLRTEWLALGQDHKRQTVGEGRGAGQGVQRFPCGSATRL
jgi:hypothetical protein